MSEASERVETPPSHEWTNFIVLAVILLGTIVVVALLRPLIFHRVVPAVMGEGRLTAPIPAQDIQEPYPAQETSPLVPTAGEDEAAPVTAPYPAEAQNEEMSGEALPTAVSTVSYTVQHGDTILSIARRYGVSVEAIVTANKISNPNHIEVGTTLLIPQ
ncbi:MAG: LysM peptidoglycan-binding domain-containing protein [Anaerolineae bacterium]